VKRRIYDLLDRPGGRRLLGWLGSLYGSLRLRRLFRVFPDGGLWVHRAGDHYFVLRHLHIPTRAEARRLRSVSGDVSLLLPKAEETPLRPGDTAVDIGAGTGATTFVLSKLVGSSGTVLSVEANPTSYRCLEKTCRYNGLENVILECSAVMDEKGEVLIEDGADHLANHVFSETGIRTRATTVDDLVSSHGIDEIGLLLMNIEGAERLAIQGMSASIGRTRCAAIACHDFRADAEGLEGMRTKTVVSDFLRRNGFEIQAREPLGKPSADDWVVARNLAHGMDEFPHPFGGLTTVSDQA
jgi:FkbM family methyltransferase